MNCDEAIAYIHSVGWHRGAPGLERIRTLMEALGNPQDDLRFLHVAGTNGKGSVSAMLDSVLRAAGYRVGLFTSPYIRNFRERIRMEGEMIGEDELAEIAGIVRSKAEETAITPTEFELICAIAFVYYHRKRPDFVVLEVGLGGRLDPTNIIQTPLISIITGVDFDHTELLGNTIQSIAAEKAGIIKENVPVLYGGNQTSACRTIRSIAEQRHADFYGVDRSSCRITEQTLDGTVMDFQNYRGLKLSLLGSYQPQNAVTALTALNILEERGALAVPEKAIRRGLSEVRWMARFELLSQNPVILYDGGHNPEGVGGAVRSIKTYFPEQKVYILSGVMADKDYDAMVRELGAVTEKAFTVTPENPRALDAESYAACFRQHKIPAEPYATVLEAVGDAVRESIRQHVPLVCLGSLYLYNTVVEEIERAIKEETAGG